MKLIGATAHFVTAELDAGPIIAQDVIAVDHSFTPERMARWYVRLYERLVRDRRRLPAHSSAWPASEPSRELQAEKEVSL